MADYNPMELMICVAARNLEDGATVVVGTGAPCAAAMLAQKTHSPNLTIMFEAGGVAPILPAMPISVGDSRTFHKAILASSMPDIMETCQRGMVDYTFLGGAQIDMYGNINSTMIGDNHAKPKVRFPGIRRSERPGLPLLEDHDDDAAGREALHGKDGFHHVSGLSDRRQLALRGGSSQRDRPLPDHHQHGDHGV